MLEIEHIELFRVDLRTRLPFRYGIAEMTEVPHLFLQLDGRFGQSHGRGLAADHLPPRWFKKDPQQPLDDEIAEMTTVIRRACRQAIGRTAENPFQWWRTAYREQMAWARAEGIPPLLAHFGVTLVERALIDAASRAAEQPFHTFLLTGKLGFNPAEVHPELRDFSWRTALPEQPLESVTVRHTVGLDDPLTPCPDGGARLDDGLPETLAEAIGTYGLRHFKIKLRGELEADRQRLAELEAIFRKHCPSGFAFSLDLNEAYPSIAAFRESWQQIRREPLLASVPERLLFIEQPVHRDNALRPEGKRLDDLPGSPRVIIDEADAEIESLPRALELGYAGTSHKNCKGVFKGLANRCLLAKRRLENHRNHSYLMSGEDLANVGPVALLQDLSVQATLGVESVERNGHHYFRGLSAYPPELNEAIVRAHPDLYSRHDEGWATLRIHEGKLDLTSLSASGLGPAFPLSLDFASNLPLETT